MNAIRRFLKTWKAMRDADYAIARFEEIEARARVVIGNLPKPEPDPTAAQLAQSGLSETHPAIVVIALNGGGRVDVSFAGTRDVCDHNGEDETAFILCASAAEVFRKRIEPTQEEEYSEQ